MATRFTAACRRFFNLDREAANRVRRQLGYFRRAAYSAFAFRMVIEQAGDKEPTASRANLYERYFRRLLQVPAEKDLDRWTGWLLVLEAIADFTCLSTGYRGS